MSFYNLDENCPKIKQPKGLNIKLKPHQLTCICAMNELENQSSILIDKPNIASGLYQSVKCRLNDIDEFTESTYVIETNSLILADKVGAGKTYTVIGLILLKQVPVAHDRFIMGTDHFSIKMMSVKDCENVNLIVVPHNLANQWGDFMSQSKLKYLKLNSISDFDIFFDIDYVTNKTLVLTPLTIYNKTKKTILPEKTKGGSKTKKTTIIFERRVLNSHKIKKILDRKQVIILNINRYKFFKQIFKSTKWARVFIDEMDSANIPTSFDEFGNFNWFLTATPTSIFQKSCRRYVNKIFGYNHNLIEYFTVKNNDHYVDTSMVLPNPHIFMIRTLLHRVVSAIKDLIPGDVLQLINAGNMKEAISKLNCNIDTEENIIKVLTDKINVEIHNLKLDLDHASKIIAADPVAHEKHVQKLNMDIATRESKLQTIKERIKSVKKECCFICAESFDNPAILDCCKSVFCLKCLLSSLKMANNKCPYCRKVIKSNKEYHIISSGSKKKPSKKVSKSKFKKFTEMDKADVLEHLLKHISKNNENPKILIFSDYSQTFDKILKNIAKADLQYAFISGIPSHITNVITEFNNGVTNILLMDSQHYGSGLNLQAAQYLILYHRMTPELETQVVGRAQRYGRKERLKIIYLVNETENQCTKLSLNPINLDIVEDLPILDDPPVDDDNIYHDEEDDPVIEETDDKNKKHNKKINNDTEDTEDTENDNKKPHKRNKKIKSDTEDPFTDDTENDNKKHHKRNKKIESDTEDPLIDDEENINIIDDENDSDNQQDSDDANETEDTYNDVDIDDDVDDSDQNDSSESEIEKYEKHNKVKKHR